jgi:glycerol-3-phosphate dehydrogenase
MGAEIMPGLFEAEAEYWIEHEWATCAADMLWRRSKLGLHLPAGAEAALDDWTNNYRDRALRPAARAQH